MNIADVKSQSPFRCLPLPTLLDPPLRACMCPLELERKDGSYRSRVVDRTLAQLPPAQTGQLAIVTRMIDTYRAKKCPRDEANK